MKPPELSQRSVWKTTQELAQYSADEVNSRGKRGMLLMVTSRLSGMIIALLSNAIMGRLLKPEDYGLVAMASSAIILLNLLKDFGLTTAVVQTKEISAQQLDAVFWLNILVAVSFALLGSLSAPWVADFFGYPAIVSVLLAMCGTLVVSSISATHSALLRRHLNFNPLMWSEVAGQLVGLVVGVSVAWLFKSYWAIVLSQVCAAIASTTLIFASIRWIPGAPKALASASGLLKFGANISVFSLLNFFSNQLGAIVTGAWFGASAAGHFNRAQQLLSLTGSNLMQPISQTALPILSRHQNAPEAYRDYYLKLLQRTSLFFGLLGAFVIVAGDAIATTLMGPQWNLAGDMYRWFGLSIIAVGMASQTGNVLISQNRTKELRHWGFGDAAIRAGASVCGALLGALGIAAAFGAATLFVTVPIVGWIVSRRGPVNLQEQFTAMRSGAIVAVLSVALGLVVRSLYWPTIPLVAAAFGFFLATIALATAAVADKRTLEVLIDAFSELKDIFQKSQQKN